MIEIGHLRIRWNVRLQTMIFTEIFSFERSGGPIWPTPVPNRDSIALLTAASNMFGAYELISP